ncbi:DNA-directed RNA polymerase subunit K [archaeon]|nr:DNA-directed RNA polymerase subunit K [archaeon]
MSKLTRFEITRLISARALQLSLGAPSMIKGDKGLSLLDAAKVELEKKVIPIAVLREFPDGSIEMVEAD